MVGIAVLGCGRIGRMHPANVAAHSRAQLGGVFDMHRPAVEGLSTNLNARLFDSAEAVRESADIDQRDETLGSGGMAVSENVRVNNAAFHGEDFTGKAASLMNVFIDRYAATLTAEILAFVEAVETGVAPEVGFEDGPLALVLTEATFKSAAEGRIVNLSEIG